MSSGSERLTSLLDASKLAWTRGTAEQGAEQASAALALAQQLAARSEQALALTLLGMHEQRLGRSEPALQRLAEAASIFAELGDDGGTAYAQSNMVLVYHMLGLTDEAVQVSALSVEHAYRTGQPLDLALAYLSVSNASDAAGNFADALAAADLAYEYACAAHDEQSQFSALYNRADDLLKLANAGGPESPQSVETIAKALSAASDALAVARRLSPFQEGMALSLLGSVRQAAGDFETAAELFATGLTLAQEGEFELLTVDLRLAQAQLACDLGELEQAATTLEQLLAQLEPNPALRPKLATLAALWPVLKRLGRFEQALTALERHQLLDQRLRTEQAATRARVLANRVELHQMQRAIDVAAHDAEQERQRALKLQRQAEALQQRSEELRLAADQDRLTGLWNRGYFERALPEALQAGAADATPITLVMVDADNFKQVNDSFGHLTGDAVLRVLARLLGKGVRRIDFVARLGGEEFVIVLPGVEVAGAVELAQRLAERIRKYDWSELLPGRTQTVSLGIASVSPAADVERVADAKAAAKLLLARADGALYEAKRGGRDRVAVSQQP